MDFIHFYLFLRWRDVSGDAEVQDVFPESGLNPVDVIEDVTLESDVISDLVSPLRTPFKMADQSDSPLISPVNIPMESALRKKDIPQDETDSVATDTAKHSSDEHSSDAVEEPSSDKLPLQLSDSEGENSPTVSANGTDSSQKPSQLAAASKTWNHRMEGQRRALLRFKWYKSFDTDETEVQLNGPWTKVRCSSFLVLHKEIALVPCYMHVFVLGTKSMMNF